MAKKKSKKNKSQPTQLSPERYMREKVRSLPIGKCYVTPDWEKNGVADVIISRMRPNGNLAIGVFLVDTFCLGIKEAFYHTNITEDDLNELLHKYKDGPGITEISYNEAHNIIYGAISFAEEGGINPVKEFHTSRFILEEDTEDIPLIEYNFGKNGRHYLIIGKERKEMHHLNTLRKTLGNNFIYLIEDDEIGSPYFYDNTKHYPSEEYTYKYPNYPQTVSVKNSFIADALFSPDYFDSLPPEIINRILALPADEAAEDISNIIMYVIGQTYKAINDGKEPQLENGALMHALLLLTQLQSEKGLDAVLEIMRQNGNFADYHLGDLAPEVIHPALFSCGKNNTHRIEAYLYEPGLDNYLRAQAPETLAMILYNYPERHDEIIAIFRKLLTEIVSRLPNQNCCDAEYAGFVISYLLDLKIKELLPEIKNVFDTGCVDESIAGDYNEIVEEIENGDNSFQLERYKFPDINAQYDRIKYFGS